VLPCASALQELFLNDIVVKSHENTSAKRRKTMQLQDIGACLAPRAPALARERRAPLPTTVI
jgi:histone H3/H4